MNMHPVIFVCRLINKRCTWLPCIALFGICVIIFVKNQSDMKRTELETSILRQTMEQYSSNTLTFDDVKFLLDQLLDPLIPLIDIQSIWNKLMKIWHSILTKFVHDACELCHKNQSNCYESMDLIQYVYYINKSFYPFNEIKRPIGMGIYYYFDLKTLHSLNNSILSTDISYCDYFHMIQLMINVQIILHKTKINYFITKGTLIGVLRHHDIIPWDADIDLFIPSSAVNKILTSFRQFDLLSDNIDMTIRNSTTRSKKAPQSYQQDLVVYHFKNKYKVHSYKIFSLRSPIINDTNYRWPKIDIFSYRENSTHIYAYPKHRHNLGTMNYILKTNIEPLYLRLLGPLLVPSPYHLSRSLKAMIKLGESNVFFVCEGNTFLHRYNQMSSETWRVPCRELYKTYPFVKHERNSTTNLCYEQLMFSQQNQSLSLYKYKCNEDLQRTL